MGIAREFYLEELGIFAGESLHLGDCVTGDLFADGIKGLGPR